MPNHVHLLLRTGEVPLSRVLQRLFTGYAISFNRRWERSGHVFQGRYKSLLCESDFYLRELVRYIHLNPVRAKLCEGLPGLSRFAWTGHRAILGLEEYPWQDTATVREAFGSRSTQAKKAYLAYCSDGLSSSAAPSGVESRLQHLVEGGWVSDRSPEMLEGEGKDERILGSERFVQQALHLAHDRERWRSHAMRRGRSIDRVLVLAARKAGAHIEAMTGSGKNPAVVHARALACYWLVDRLGYPGILVARRLGISSSAVSKCVRRGEAYRVNLKRGIVPWRGS